MKSTILKTSKSQCTPMTQCSKGGVKIRDGKNEYKADPFAGIDPFRNPNKSETSMQNVVYSKNAYDRLDLDIDNYSREDIFSAGEQNHLCRSETDGELNDHLLRALHRR